MTKPEKLSHIGILLIGISALVVSVWQVQLSRAHNKLSVRPYLRINSSNLMNGVDGHFKHELSISNSGQGPAIIKYFEFSVAGQKSHRITDAMAWSGLEGIIGEFMVMEYDPGDVLEEKRSEILLGINDISLKQKPIHIKVVYESLYKEEFTVETDY